MKTPLRSSLRYGITIFSALLSLHSAAWAQDKFDPDAINALKNLITKYQGMKSYSDDTIVITNTPGAKPNTFVAHSRNVSLAWGRDVGLRIEGDSDPAKFVVRYDGQQVHLHWFKHAGPDSDSPVNENTDFLNQPMPGLPYDIPDIGIITGGVSTETLDALHINSMGFSPKGLFMDHDGNAIKCYTITLDYNDAAQRHINLNLTVGEGDGLLYSSAEQVEAGTSRYAISEVHSNIKPGATLPEAYWKLDFPLMGDAGAVAPPSPLSVPGIVSTLPTLTALDLGGKDFTISPDDKKTVLFFFFYPGGARYTIDDVQELAEEGEARGLKVVGIVQNLGIPANRTPSAIQAFRAEHHVTFPVIFQENGDEHDISHQLGNNGAASQLIYGADGKLLSDEDLLQKGTLRATLNQIAPIKQ